MNPTAREAVLEKLELNCPGKLCPGWGLPDFQHHLLFFFLVGTPPSLPPCFIKCLFVLSGVKSKGKLMCDYPHFPLPS